MVGTLSQSDYRWGHSANQITGVRRGCARRGYVCRGCACRGACAGVVGTLSQSDYRWGHSANQITGAFRGACAGVHVQGCVRRGGGDTRPIRLQVGTLSQSDYRCVRRGACAGDARAGDARAGGARTGGAHAGDVRTGGMRAGVVGTLSQSDYRWGHSANQITGVRRGACAGVCVKGMCMQGVCAQGVCTQGMCAQGVRAQGWWGHSANQITGRDTQPIRLQVRTGGACAGGCAHRVRGGVRRGYHWLPLATIDLVGDNGEF